MASRKQVEEMLLLSFIHGFISEEEFGVLHEALQTKNPIFPHSDYERFTLDTLEESEIFAEFRVRKRDIERLADALGLPESFVCHQRTRADKIEGLCMVLKRLAYPCRYSDLIHRFGRAVPELSMITNAVEEFIYQNHHHRLTQWNATLLSPRKLQQVCWCSGSERFSIEKLLRIHRWHRKTNIKTGWKPKNSVQWAQEAPCPKVSVRYAAGWANCASFWTCW